LGKNDKISLTGESREVNILFGFAGRRDQGGNIPQKNPLRADKMRRSVMKLILAIVSNDDSGAVSSSLTKSGFQVTKLATTGGFLMAGNTTFISGVDDEKVDEVISIIAKHSSRRTQVVPSTSTMDVGMYSSFPVEVTVGGSTIFVLNVDRFEKV
jgi:uncharacterized protein YaaQ